MPGATGRDRRDGRVHGRNDNPFDPVRRTPHTGADLLTDKQAQRLTALFATGEHIEVEATWAM
jgi:hypothetical protein